MELRPGITFDDGSIYKDRHNYLTPVDEWLPKTPEDEVIKVVKGAFIVPFDKYYGLTLPEDSQSFCKFSLTAKKCYNSQDMRDHLYKYINYFEKFYDLDREYIAVLYKIKLMMDKACYLDIYTEYVFFNDLTRYILKSGIELKVRQFVEDNYMLNLNYENPRSPSLQYTNEHAKILFRISLLMDLCIPLLTNFAYQHHVENIDDFLMLFYDRIIYLYPVNIYGKLYETAYTNIYTNQKTNQGIWDKQDIRAIDITTHSSHSVRNILLNICCKYTYNSNIISFNCSSIRENTKFQVTDIGFEFSYVPISSSKRDEDSVSDFDRFEAGLIKQSESLYMQNKINYENTMDNIRMIYGPFDPEEIKLYNDRLLTDENGNPTINGFQKGLIFDMFYKYFKDVRSINNINREEYAELIIATKKILLSRNMRLLPYILSGKIEKLITRKNVNKRELMMIEASPTYADVVSKYKNTNILKIIIQIVATIISSDITIIDMDKSIDGKKIDIIPSIVIEEILSYVLLC